MESFDIGLVCLVVLVVGYFVAVHFERITMGTSADLQKLVENMKRASGIVDRAANDTVKHSLIMDSFEKRLDLNGENMGKIAEYDRLMSEMDTMGGNGGPALTTTFPSSAEVKQPLTVHTSTSGVGMFNH